MEGRQWNRISSWEEPVEIEGLTLWDINRPNHDMIVSDEKITVEKRKIDDGLHCPVCMLILKKTKVVMTCLHRFCEECIDKCLRLNKNECPACRAHVPSRRSLSQKQFLANHLLGRRKSGQASRRRTGSFI